MSKPSSYYTLSMAKENKAKPTSTTANKKRKQHYRPNNKPVKRKGSYPLRPGVQGFFITCDGGRERQASHEAINVIDSFFEELVHGKDTSMLELTEIPVKPLNKKIKFAYSDDDDDDDDEEEEENEAKEGEGEEEEAADDDNDGEKDNKEVGGDKREVNKSDTCPSNNPANEKEMSEKSVPPVVENANDGGQTEGKTTDNDEANADDKREPKEVEEPPAKKQCVEVHAPKPVGPGKVEKSVDELIEDELKELGDKSKRRFSNLDSGCNGVVFVQMRPRDGDPSPKDIVQHMMTSAAMTRKHMSRFILRVLPIEVSCYASEEEITKAVSPLVEKYFPVDAQEPQKFAVIYDARANTGIDRMKIINAVAKSVPGPHKVDLNNPDKSIVVQVVKTVCLIGVVEKYKELAKYNLRQLTSPKL